MKKVYKIIAIDFIPGYSNGNAWKLNRKWWIFHLNIGWLGTKYNCTWNNWWKKGLFHTLQFQFQKFQKEKRF